MGDCKVCDNRTLANAWQYNGDIDSVPSWVEYPPYVSVVQQDEDGPYLIVENVGSVPLNKGDWIVKSNTSNAIHVYSDDAFSLRFTIIPEKEKKPAGSVASQKYRSKPVTVLAWQYTGQSNLLELPYWVADLVLHHKLGYHPFENSDKELFQLLYEGVWVPLLDGDWLVRYSEDHIDIVSDADFKELFEEIK